MRSLISRLFVALGLGLALFGVPAQTLAQTFQTSAPYAILMDAETGTVLFEKNADELNSPASMTKIMTAEVVFREISNGRLKLDDTFGVSTNAFKSGGLAAGGSTMFANVNSQIRIEDLLRGLIVQSGNDAAIVLAEGIAGSEENFAGLMTKRARELGLTKSTFKNSWGKGEPGQKVTARELAFLANHIIKTYPEYYKYFGEKEFTWNKVRQLNRNPLLTMDIGADGLKTGNIEESGFGLVGSTVDKETGQRLIVVVNGLRTAKDRADEARKLLQWGARSFEAKVIFGGNEPVGEAKVFGGTRADVPLVANGAIKLLVPRGSSERLSGKIVYQGPLIAPVEAGQVVARLRVMRGTVQALDIPLKTAESVDVGPLHRRAYDAASEYISGLFRKYVTKK